MVRDDGHQWGDDAAGHEPDRARVSRRGAPDPGFDGYDMDDVALGDLMRGERATLGKSLLDVERELRIRATYIAAIENGDVGAFQSTGFIAGYVRSYARYLGMEPEWTFRRFCQETGFQGVHGGPGGLKVKAQNPVVAPPLRVDPNDVMRRAPKMLAPEREPLLSRLEPGALGSMAVLVALALGIGYGAWAILQDIQRLSIAPVDEAPAPLAQLDPLAGVTDGAFGAGQGFDIAVPAAEDAGRLFRPEPLQTPLMAPRDGALAALDPDETGTLSGLRQFDGAGLAQAERGVPVQRPAPVQVTQAPLNDEVLIFAVRPTWIQITSAGGTTLFEGTLNAGDTWTLPEGDAAPTLLTGNSGALYFAVNGVTLGPAGEGASIVRDVELSADALSASFAMADAGADPDLPRVAELVLGAEAQ